MVALEKEVNSYTVAAGREASLDLGSPAASITIRFPVSDEELEAMERKTKDPQIDPNCPSCPVVGLCDFTPMDYANYKEAA